MSSVGNRDWKYCGLCLVLGVGNEDIVVYLVQEGGTGDMQNICLNLMELVNKHLILCKQVLAMKTFTFVKL